MANTELRVAILGVTGRMGRALLQALDEVPDARLVGATASVGSQWVGQDVAAPQGGKPRGLAITADAAAAVRDATVAIDFTLPAATEVNLRASQAAGCALLIGTTGHDERGRAAIAAAAAHLPLILAANTSLGINLLLRLSELAAQVLDDSYDLEIFEAHHRHKKDAPSGTALALGRAAAAGRNVSLDDVGQYARQGVTGERKRGDIGFSVFRGGDVVGEHTVTFAGIGERIELTHRASDRMTFARGAVRAAQWLSGRVPGMYSMQDVLGLESRTIVDGLR
jgi:4-hydroxy-tetrahydrodipicolinate reductase